MSEWINAKARQPENSDPVLCVKENSKGNRSICIGCWHADLREYNCERNEYVNTGRWVTGGGNNNVILWTPLPDIPAKDTGSAELEGNQ